MWCADDISPSLWWSWISHPNNSANAAVSNRSIYPDLPDRMSLFTRLCLQLFVFVFVFFYYFLFFYLSLSFFCLCLLVFVYNYSRLCFNYSHICFNYSHLCFNYSRLCFNYSHLCFNYWRLCFNYSLLCFNFSRLCFRFWIHRKWMCDRPILTALPVVRRICLDPCPTAGSHKVRATYLIRVEGEPVTSHLTIVEGDPVTSHLRLVEEDPVTSHRRLSACLRWCRARTVVWDRIVNWTELRVRRSQWQASRFKLEILPNSTCLYKRCHNTMRCSPGRGYMGRDNIGRGKMGKGNMGRGDMGSCLWKDIMIHYRIGTTFHRNIVRTVALTATTLENNLLGNDMNNMNNMDNMDNMDNMGNMDNMDNMGNIDKMNNSCSSNNMNNSSSKGSSSNSNNSSSSGSITRHQALNQNWPSSTEVCKYQRELEMRAPLLEQFYRAASGGAIERRDRNPRRETPPSRTNDQTKLSLFLSLSLSLPPSLSLPSSLSPSLPLSFPLSIYLSLSSHSLLSLSSSLSLSIFCLIRCFGYLHSPCTFILWS